MATKKTKSTEPVAWYGVSPNNVARVTVSRNDADYYRDFLDSTIYALHLSCPMCGHTPKGEKKK